MKFPSMFYLLAITFISTSILVQSFGQLISPTDPRTDGGPTKKLSRISEVYDALKIQNLDPSSKASDNGITSVLSEPLSDVTPVENMVKANTGQSFQASGDNSAVGRHLILKRDTAAENAEDEEYLEHRKTSSGNWKSDLSIHKRDSPDELEQATLQMYETDAEKKTISIRLTPVRLVLDGVDCYYVQIVKNKKAVYYTNRFQVTEDLRCKHWDDALCFENLIIASIDAFDIQGSEIKVSGEKNGVKVAGKQWDCDLQLDGLTKDPGPPKNLRIITPYPGIVKFKWKHPWHTYTKIQRFRIRLTVTKTTPIESLRFVSKIVDVDPGVPDQKEYESGLIQLRSSSRCHVEVAAKNQHGFGAPAQDDFTTPSWMYFESAEVGDKSNLGWLAIIPITAIVAILLLFLRYRKRTKSSEVPKRPSYLEVIPLTPTNASGPSFSEETDSVLQPNAEGRRTSAYLYSMPNEPDSWRVPVENFEEYVKNAVTSAQLNSQFKLLPKGSTKPSDYGRLLGNIRKNRSSNLIAYDDTRVVLRKIPGEPYSDYINANYIRGFGKERAYIATQGPMSNTVEDFWRMVWQEDVRIVCMLTNVIEDGEEKCVQYWPDIRAKVRYGDIVILNEEHQIFADFTFRSFKLRYQQQTRDVAHLHYTGWPSFGIPTYPQSLTLYLKKLLKLPTGDGPVVVHCNTGDDRTGTIILCDISLREVVYTKAIDVPGVTTRMRESRANMVGTLQQFLLAHIVITEVLMVRPTQVPCDKLLPKRMRELRNRLPCDIKRLNETMWQQQTLKSLAEPKPLGVADDADDGLPGEGTTEVVYANLHSTFESRISQIGAVSVDGVKMKRQHLASHLPPPFKLSDFWGFVTENDVKLIIILQCSDPGNPSCSDVIPDESIVLQMPDTEFVAETNSQNVDEEEYFKSEKLTLFNTSQENAEPQSVTVLTCGGWARGSNGKPPKPVALVSLWTASEKIPREEGQTLVLCHDGITACGLYLAMSFLLERMAVERECDVISAVRAVRRSRPEFVQSVEQCEYLYDAAETYAEYFEGYANFT